MPAAGPAWIKDNLLDYGTGWFPRLKLDRVAPNIDLSSRSAVTSVVDVKASAAVWVPAAVISL